MNTLDTSGSTFIERISVRLKRGALRRHLAARSDRQLADMGISRALLEDGVKAWPWRQVEETARATGGTSGARVIDLRAVYERPGPAGDAVRSDEAA